MFSVLHCVFSPGPMESSGAVEFFTKDTNEPVEFRLLPYDVNSVMHFGNREFSKNGHKTIIFKDVSSQQNRIGLTTNDIRKFDIVYGPECLKRDRQERIDICQSYPNVARQKRDTSNVKDVINDKNDQHSDKNDKNGNKTVEKRDKNDQVNFRSNKTTESQDKNSDRNNNTDIMNTVDNKPATVSLDDEKLSTKSLRVNPNITPPPNLRFPHNLHELGIEEEVQTIVENIYKVSAVALKNSRQKYCKTTEKKNLRTVDKHEKASDILGIINLISNYAQDMVDDAMGNLTKFCDDSNSITNYERARCDFNIGGNPKCTPSYRSTKHGLPHYSTQHRPFIRQSTKHANRYDNSKYHNIVRRSNVTAKKPETKREKVKKSGIEERKSDKSARTKREISVLDESVRAKSANSSSAESSTAKTDISVPNGIETTTIITENTVTVTMATDKQEIVREQLSSTTNINTGEYTETTTDTTLDTTEPSHDLEVKKLPDKPDLRMATGFLVKDRGTSRADYSSFMRSRPKDHLDSDVSNEKNTKIRSNKDKRMKDTSFEKENYLPSKKRETQIDIIDKIPKRNHVAYDKQETKIPPKYHEIRFEKENKDIQNRNLHDKDRDAEKIPNRMYDIPLKIFHGGKISKSIHKTEEHEIYKSAKMLLQKGIEILDRKDGFSLQDDVKIPSRRHSESRRYVTKEHNVDGNKPFRPSPIIQPKHKRYHNHGAGPLHKQPEDEDEIKKAKLLRIRSQIQGVLGPLPGPSRFRVVRPELDGEKRAPKEGMKTILAHNINTFKKPAVESWKNKEENKNIYEESSDGDGNENRKLKPDRELKRERNKRDRELEQNRNRGRESKRELERNRNKERNRDRESERDRNQNKESNRNRERDWETERHNQKDRESERDRNRDRESERDRNKNKKSNRDRERDREIESDISKERDHGVRDHDRPLEQHKREQDREQRDRKIRDHSKERGRQLKQDRELDRGRESARDRKKDSTEPQSYEEKQEQQRFNKNKRQKYGGSERESKKQEEYQSDRGSVPPTVQLSKLNKEFYKERRWPGGVVRYIIKPGLKYDYDDIYHRIEEVNAILKKRTCVRLEKISQAQAEQFEDYLFIDDSPDYVTGRVGGKQNFGAIELLEGGQHRQHTAMMVMAMLGFYFEVSRHDRDSHIRVHPRHVRPDKLHHFEKIREDATLAVPYDYKSATHPAWQFWRQFGVTGISSVATYKQTDPDGSLMKSLGQNTQLLSDTDILKINSVYGVRCFMKNNSNKRS